MKNRLKLYILVDSDTDVNSGLKLASQAKDFFENEYQKDIFEWTYTIPNRMTEVLSVKEDIRKIEKQLIENGLDVKRYESCLFIFDRELNVQDYLQKFNTFPEI